MIYSQNHHGAGEHEPGPVDAVLGRHPAEGQREWQEQHPGQCPTTRRHTGPDRRRHASCGSRLAWMLMIANASASTTWAVISSAASGSRPAAAPWSMTQ
jgi:hypothetical protein